MLGFFIESKISEALGHSQLSSSFQYTQVNNEDLGPALRLTLVDNLVGEGFCFTGGRRSRRLVGCFYASSRYHSARHSHATDGWVDYDEEIARSRRMG